VADLFNDAKATGKFNASDAADVASFGRVIGGRESELGKRIGEYGKLMTQPKPETVVKLVIDVDEAGNFFARVADSKQLTTATTKIVIQTAADEARKVAR